MSRVWTMSTVYSAVLPPSFGIYFISLRLCPFPPFTPKHPKNVFFCFTKSEQWAIPLQKYCKFNFGQSCLDCKDLPPPIRTKSQLCKSFWSLLFYEKLRKSQRALSLRMSNNFSCSRPASTTHCSGSNLTDRLLHALAMQKHWPQVLWGQPKR